MKVRTGVLSVGLCFLVSNVFGAAINISLGTADAFAVLAGSTVTNTGPSVIDGNVGVFPGSAVVGFPPGVIVPPGTLHAADAVAQQAQLDQTTAYNVAAGQSCGTNLSGTDLGGQTLLPGVYCFDSSAQLTGTLTLNALGSSDSVFIFQIGSTLTTAGDSSVAFINGGQGGAVFYQVGSSATLGTNTDFAGNILALTSITLNTGASINCGRALAQNGAVSLDTNNVSINSPGCESTIDDPTAVPEPASAGLISMSVLAGAMFLRRRLRK